MIYNYTISAVSECPADVIFVIDRSGSMSSTYSTVLNFAKTIVSGFELSDNLTRVGIIVFDRSASIEVSEDNDNHTKKETILRKNILYIIKQITALSLSLSRRIT